MSEKVPAGWKLKSLRSHLQQLPKSKLPSGASNPKGLFDFYVCSREVQKSDYCEWLDPAILFSTGGEAAVHFPQSKYAYSTDVWATTFTDPFSDSYVYRVLENSLEHLNYAGFQGSGIKHLDKEFLKRTTICLPPPTNSARSQTY
ncbi:MAG: restriction endonuclease subunit S [Gammaproteobacteria bacterium AqS3]|nr:restriction endonuclease subunit S [Gammaproteobacteria bacterium AqS3]